MKALTRFALATLICGWLVFPVQADDPDTAQIVAKVDRITLAVKNVTYKAEIWVEGDPAVKQARIAALVKAKESAGGKLPLLWIDGVITMPDSGEKRAFQVFLNEKQAADVNMEKKRYIIGQLPEAIDLVMEPMRTCVMQEFLHPTPFSDELNAQSRVYEGVQDVAGVKCHVIYVVYREGAESRWYFGVDDYLPHRVDRISKNSKGAISRVLELRDIDVTTRLEADVFKIQIPAGFEQEEYQPKKCDSNGLLSVGTMAPDWTLKTPGGEAVTLSKLRGKVVLMDFWATWCGPCKIVMPKLQKMHEKFEDQPFELFGVNIWERSDPVAFMKEKKYTYGLLMNGDKVAKQYRVRGIPTLYLIGPDGKILYATTGITPSHEKKLGELIRVTLKKMGD